MTRRQGCAARPGGPVGRGWPRPVHGGEQRQPDQLPGREGDHSHRAGTQPLPRSPTADRAGQRSDEVGRDAGPGVRQRHRGACDVGLTVLDRPTVQGKIRAEGRSVTGHDRTGEPGQQSAQDECPDLPAPAGALPGAGGPGAACRHVAGLPTRARVEAAGSLQVTVMRDV